MSREQGPRSNAVHPETMLPTETSVFRMQEVAVGYEGEVSRKKGGLNLGQGVWGHWPAHGKSNSFWDRVTFSRVTTGFR